MNFLNLKVQLAKGQFAILLLGFILQRSPAVQILSLFEKASRLPTAQVVKSTTWLATGMGLFHATAGATGLQSSVNLGTYTNRTSFTCDVGEEVVLTIRLENTQVSYWEVDANSDLIDGLDFVSDALPAGTLEGPLERTGGPAGVNNYYRIHSQQLTLSGTPTTPSQIATLEPDGFFSNQNVLGVKAYFVPVPPGETKWSPPPLGEEWNGESDGGWYEIAVEVPLTVPQILRSPDITRVPTGGRAQFFFEAEGVVESVQWLKNGVEIPGETSQTLVIPEASAADEGAYSVEVTNSSGSAVSAAGTLTIDDAATAKLVNLATRGFVGSGADIMIGGLTVLGGSTKTVLVRGLGPQLTLDGVPGALADPELKVFQTLFDEVPIRSQLLVTNDNWEEGPNAAELAEALIGQNKPLATGSKDAALLLTLNQGVYTFQLSGVGDTEGVGLIELFVVE
ncbi:MAG: hypothetical protein VYC82_04660 [Verrucomicrobiota bacterium]|nr:hypothetical protein [Verrucomicrobiota bacterium]